MGSRTEWENGDVLVQYTGVKGEEANGRRNDEDPSVRRFIIHRARLFVWLGGTIIGYRRLDCSFPLYKRRKEIVCLSTI